MFSLKPLELNPPKSLKKSTKPKKIKRFGVYDIEGREWINHVVSAFYTENEEEMTTQLEFFKSVPEFIKFCFSEKNEVNEIYCHFGAIYDFLFILDSVVELDGIHLDKLVGRGNGLLKFDLISGNRRITFRDSSALLPFGLDSITKAFGVKHKKLKMDRNAITEDTPEVREYLKYDCVGLYESLVKFRNWGKVKQVGMKSTIASQSIQVLRSYLKEEIPSLPKDIDAFVRKSYFGGRTEIFRPYFDGQGKEKIQYVDVNSLYPTVMKNLAVPYVYKEHTNKFEIGKDVGFIDCTVYIPESLYIPPLPSIVEGKLMFVTGVTRGNWSSYELEYAMKYGVKILKVHSCITFAQPKFIFKDYIEDLYKMRLEAKEKKDGVTDTMCKLLMNSCYGRMGLNRNREELIVDNFTKNAKPVFTFVNKHEEVLMISKRDSYVKNTFSNVAIAAWITSGARVHLHKLLMENEKGIHYCDTDSLFTTKKNKTGNELGELKLEYELDKAIFLLPKTYALHCREEIFNYILENGDKHRMNTKFVMKGFDRGAMYQDTNKFTLGDFAEALEGNLRGLKMLTKPKMARMKTAFREGKLLMMTKASTKQIRSMYDKRRVFKDQKGNWETEPWQVKNNEIINRSKT